VKRVISILTGIFLIALLAGILAMILHFPFNTLVILISGISAAVLLLLRYALNRDKRPSDIAKHLGLSLYVLSRVWTLAHWKFSRELSWVGLILIAVWISWRYIEDEDGWNFLRSYFKSGMLILGIGVNLFAVCFKMLHWMGADILLITGFSVIALWVFTHFVVGAFRAEADLK